MVILRFAPVPSGNLHIGGLRVFLINWLMAKKINGKFILRFDDTNHRTSFHEYKESLIKTLSWLGFNPPVEIFHQSERHEIYRKIAIDLVKKGYAYPCFCHEKICHCKTLAFNDISVNISKGINPAYRFKVKSEEIEIEDMIKEKIIFKTSLLSDFLIIRNDGTALYNFACVIDDMLMKITHVIRGEDHLLNTPEQILIYRALNMPLPQFGHLPLILTKDGRKYSKGELSPSIFDLKRTGFLPEGIVNYIYHTGSHNSNYRNILSIDEMIEHFDLSGISKSYIHFDMAHLKYFNKKAISARESDDLAGICLDFFKSRGIKVSNKNKVIIPLLSELKKRSSDFSHLLTSIYSMMGEKLVLNKKSQDYIKFSSKKIELLKKIVSDKDYEKIKEKIMENRKLFGKLIRLALTGDEEGLPLNILLDNISLSFLREKINLLTDISPVKIEYIEENIINYYFKKHFNLKINKMEKLMSFRNLSWKVICGKEKFIVKKAVEASFKNLYYEKEVLKHFGSLNLSPQEPYLDLTGGFFHEALLIYRWEKGKILKKFTEASMRLLADYLCNVHSYAIQSLPYLPTSSLISFYNDLVKNFEYYRYLRNEEGLEEDSLSRLISDYISSLKPFMVKLNHLWETEIPLSLIHGDLRPSNIILNKNNIMAIDWEEAGLGDPAYEISWFFRTNEFKKKEEEVFINIYKDMYNKKFPKDETFSERLTIYNIINSISYYLNMAIRSMELLRGNLKSSVPYYDYIHMEREKIYKGLASGFNIINELLNKEIHYRPGALKKMGEIIPIPPVLKNKTIIVIDGPAATGKSSVAPKIAGRLNFFYINSGAFFRAVAYKLGEYGIDGEDEYIKKILANTDISYFNIEEPPYFKILIDEKDITGFLYKINLEKITGYYGRKEVVINFIRDLFLKMYEDKKGLVIEGRKSGIEFFPKADFKFFISMDKDERIRLKSEMLQIEDKEAINNLLDFRDNMDFEDENNLKDYNYNIIDIPSWEPGKVMYEIFKKVMRDA